jgi:hypothetical protein
MAANDRFAAHTRSASFALTLSQPQIEWLLVATKVDELRRKYPWYQPAAAEFGTADELAIQWASSTVRALARKGLVDVTPLPPPCSMYDVVRLTTAGQLMVDLLAEAEFVVDPRLVPGVPLHPDDRVVLDLGASTSREPTFTTRSDRRDPHDGPYLRMGHRAQRAPAG